ncbi:MAG: hypothetical protein K2Y05_07135, partial [Hyphomicrobiaceae bacterium]|nr:hypothetical protein [Hyphomicrobiaceae bacterium]
PGQSLVDYAYQLQESVDANKLAQAGSGNGSEVELPAIVVAQGTASRIYDNQGRLLGESEVSSEGDVTTTEYSSTAVLRNTVRDGTLIGQSVEVESGTTISRTRNTAVAESDPDAWKTTVTTADGNEIHGTNIGLALGSSLGQALAGGNPFVGIAAGTVLGALTADIGAAFGRSLDQNIDLEEAFAETADNFSTTLGDAFRGQVTGAASAFLSGELTGALGVGNSFGGQLLRSVTGSVTNTVLSNALTIAQQIANGAAVTASLFDKITGNLGTGISSFLGGYIAHLIVQPENVGGSIGGTVLGSGSETVLGSIGSSILGVFGVEAGALGAVQGLNFILPGLGVLVGTLLGTVLGNFLGHLFGGSNEGGSWQSTAVDLTTGHLTFGDSGQQRSGDYFPLVHGLAQAAINSSNSLIDAVGGKLVSGPTTRFYTYRNGSQFVWDSDSYGANGSYIESATRGNELRVNLAVSGFIRAADIAGGDIYLKRALKGSQATTIQAVAGDLQIAQDYRRYLANKDTIDALISLDPNSAFAAGWVVTLLRAQELGIDKIQRSDFLGGVQNYLRNLDLEQRFDATAADVSFEVAGTTLKLKIGSESGQSPSVINIDNYAGLTDLTPVAASATGAEVDGTRGNDLWRALDGVDSKFVDHSARLDTDSNDVLIGASGNDTILAGIGGDLLLGGAGNDSLDGGAGDDVIAGGTGNDTLLGGAGDDVYVFRRGDGRDVIDDTGLVVKRTQITQQAVYRTTTSYAVLAAQGPLSLLSELRDASGNILQFASYDQALSYAQNVCDFSTGNCQIETLTQQVQVGFVDVESEVAQSVPVGTLIDGGKDTLRFGPGITSDDLHLTIDGADLVIDIRDAGGTFSPTGDRIVIRNWNDPAHAVETATFADGSTIDFGKLASDHTRLGGAGDDTLEAGGGWSLLSGGAGNDTYLIRKNSGTSYISTAGENSGTDRVVFADLTIADLTLDYPTAGAGKDLRLRWTRDGISGELRIANQGLGIERFEFADGTILDAAHIVGLLASPGDDIISFTAGPASISAGGGNDQITTGAFDDTIDGGSGNDTLSAGSGNNFLRGGDGNDLIVAGAGRDQIDGGAGIDTIAYAAVSQAITADLGIGTVTRPDGTSDTVTGVENVIGTNLGDKLTGNTSANLLSGSGGNDTLFGSLGSDTLDGGAGNDTADYSRLASGITIDFAKSIVTKGDGSTDQLVSIEAVVASPNADLILGDGTSRVLSGGAGSDTIRGGTGSETIDGGSGDDLLSGGLGVNAIFGGDGADIILGGFGTDSIDGGAGSDTVDYSSLTSAVSIDLGAGTATKSGGVVDRLSNIENVTGTAYADALVGDANGNVLNGGAGVDTLKGGGGNDTYVFGRGSGKDTVLDDVTGPVTTAYTYYVDVYYPGPYDGLGKMSGSYVTEARTGYTTTTQQQDGGIDTLQFGDGITLDSLFLTTSGSNLIVGLRQKDANGAELPAASLSDVITLQNWQNPLNRIETFRFADGSVVDMRNISFATSGADGNDSLTGTSGNDFVLARGGNDTLVGSAGSDDLRGDAGIDTVDYTGLSSGISADLGTGRASKSSGGSDTLTGIENITGSAYSDTLTGGAGANLLSGSGGNDTLFGSLGSDTLDGGAGNDTADYSRLASGITIDFAKSIVTKGDGSTDQLVSIEAVVASPNADLILGDGTSRVLSGGAGSDTIRGGTGSETIDGGSGDDLLSGGLGVNAIFGGDGADIILGGFGTDSIDGGAGSDTVDYSSLTSAVSIDLGAGTATKSGGVVDRLSNIENVTGTAYADALVGDANGNVLNGGAGVDTLKGGGGNDTYVFGRGSGKDTVLDDVTGPVTTAYTYYVDVYYPGPYDGLGKMSGSYVTEARTGYTTTTQQQDGGIDTLQFGDGITLDSLFLTTSGSNLIVGLRQKDANGAELPAASLSDVITLQ